MRPVFAKFCGGPMDGAERLLDRPRSVVDIPIFPKPVWAGPEADPIEIAPLTGRYDREPNPPGEPNVATMYHWRGIL